MELFDERNPDGSRTGVIKERGVAHMEGALHATVHTWIVRPNDRSGYDVLLQKRSETKDSNPGCYDISSAGHVERGMRLSGECSERTSGRTGDHGTSGTTGRGGNAAVRL